MNNSNARMAFRFRGNDSKIRIIAQRVYSQTVMYFSTIRKSRRAVET